MTQFLLLLLIWLWHEGALRVADPADKQNDATDLYYDRPGFASRTAARKDARKKDSYHQRE